MTCAWAPGQNRSSADPRQLSGVIALRAWFLSVCLACGLLPSGSIGAEFELEGKMVITELSPEGATKKVLPFSFLIRVQGKQWLIHSEDELAKSGKRKSMTVMESSFDGRDMFQVFRMPSRNSSIGESADREYGYVREGSLLRQSGPWERILWLAYCSQGAFGVTGDCLSIAGPAGRLVRTSRELLAPGGLPKSVSQAISSAWGNLAETNRIDDPEEIRKHSMRFQYLVGQTTNVGGSTIPTEMQATFVEEYISARSPSGRIGPYIGSRVAISVHRVLPAIQGPIAATLSDTAYVYDYRFASKSGRPAMYMETGNKWLSRADPDLGVTLKSKAAIIPQKFFEPKHRLYGGLRLLLVGVALAPIVAFIVNRHQKKRHKESIHNTIV